MKKIWIELEKFNKKFITEAIENGVDAFFTNDKKIIDEIKKLAKIDVYDLNTLPENIKFLTIKSKDDEINASKINSHITLIIDTSDWKIIPFENLIATRNNLFASVNNIENAIESINILEKGVDGIYIKNCSDDEKLKILKEIKSKKDKIQLTTGEIILVQKITTGDRICIDTITNMTEGEGMLVGDYSHGMVLVNSESVENPYVSTRPFRVNAGAVHCYIMTPNNKTKYLSDLKSGDEVLIVNYKGECYPTVIGRIKMEKRPLLRILVKGQNNNFSVILQNAETIRIVTPDGKSKSVLSLVPGDKITIYEEKGGRHFGHKIEETITEK